MTEGRLFLLRIGLVWLLLELLAATQARTPDGTPVVWRWVQAGVAPLVEGSSQLGATVAHLIAGLGDTAQLLVDNRQMQLQLEELQARHVLLAEDLTALREASDLLAAMEGLEAQSVIGRCVFRDPARGRMEVEMATATPLERDTPVLAAGGLVGRVVRSRGSRCWIELLTHPAAATAIQTADGAVHALATGTGRPDRLELLYVPRTAALVRADVVVTSGADGIYPAGLPVATVRELRETDEAFLQVQAAPTADLATLRVVLALPSVSADPIGSRWP
jgi:rod shape-determining protein MreC